jgi:hypothetical protein
MSDTGILDEFTELDNKDFWEAVRGTAAGMGPNIDIYNEALRRILTPERCGDIARIESMTDEELAWLREKKRNDKPVRVYRCAAQGHLTGFRFHTNLQHAIDDIDGLPTALLLVGEISWSSILLRIQADGQKLVFAFPERVNVLRVDEMTKRGDIDATSDEPVEKEITTSYVGQEPALAVLDGLDAAINITSPINAGCLVGEVE